MAERTVAVIENAEVVNVVVVDADWTAPGDGSMVEYTSENPAGIGWDYDGTGFIPPQPYASWNLNGYTWEPPTPVPDDGNDYDWDEDTTSWVQV
jgi:hypothetical protein